MPAGLVLVLAALSGASGVGLGAFGAHALKARLLENATLSTWETAVHYHLIHAVALLMLAVWLRLALPTAASSAGLGYVGVAAVLFGAGIVLFSGSLYGLALGGPRWLGPVTPLGGLCFIVGWGLLAIPAFSGDKLAG